MKNEPFNVIIRMNYKEKGFLNAFVSKIEIIIPVILDKTVHFDCPVKMPV